MAALTLDKVSKIYREKGKADNRAVKAVDMAVHDGEIISLLGSSGCGKTSTLRMVAGFESVSEGQVRIGERVINDLKPAERNVAMAFEGYALYPPLTVANNIAFCLLRRCASVCSTSPSCWRSPTSWRPTRPRCRVANSSASAWRARWCARPTSGCSTSR